VLESLDAAKRGGLKALVEHPDRGGQFAWTVLSHTLAYVASLVPEVADDIVAVDRAMTLGYNWKEGPFALIDRLGAAEFAARLEAEGRSVPPLLKAAAEAGGFYRVEDGHLQYLTTKGGYGEVMRPEGVLLLEDVKRGGKPLAKNASASLWDLGDGVVCFEVHTKMTRPSPWWPRPIRPWSSTTRAATSPPESTWAWRCSRPMWVPGSKSRRCPRLARRPFSP
jgi:3-hydroxyacyl-CoA dehydrogenase